MTSKQPSFPVSVPVLGAAMVILIIAGGIASWSVRTQREATAWVSHTYEVLERVQSLSSAVASAEAAQRAYLLTGETAPLREMRAEREAALSILADLRRLTSDNASQQQRLSILAAAIRTRGETLDDVARLWTAGRTRDAIALIRTRGLSERNQLATLTRAAAAEERSLLNVRVQRAGQAARLGAAAVAGASGVAVLLLLALHLASRRHAAHLMQGHRELERSEQEKSEQARHLAEANDQLQHAAATLEQRVHDRTQALAEANADLEAFARTVAHDLRAPLRNVQGYASALAEDESERLSADGEDYTRRLIESAERLDRLITDLLDYSRLSRTALRLDAVRLDSVVDAAIDQHSRDAETTGAVIRVHGPLPAVHAHVATLQHVLSNLLGNALKFVRPGQRPEIDIAAHTEGDRVVLSVADHGIGIAPEHHERVFSVFERLHGQEAYPGTGIGLAIVRRGVERMGGEVRIHSEPESGARFELYLPAAA